MADLTGRSAVVTGSTKGIGLAVAEALLDAGASVVVSARTEADVERVGEELAGRGPGDVVGIPCDVRDPDACRRLIDGAVDALGGLDILVNNAGVGRYDPIRELSVEDWQTQIETNLGGVFYCSKAAVPHLEASGDGWIVNIGSLAGRNSFKGGTGYNASKFGLLGMSEAMMLDLRYDDVRVALVMPGSVNTYFNDSEPTPDEEWKLGADDVARAVLDLFDYPPRALPSRIEMRPTRPPRK